MKRIMLWAASVLLVILFVAGMAVWYLYHSAEQTASTMYQEISPTKVEYVSKDTEVKKTPAQATKSAQTAKAAKAASVPIKRLEPFTVLVLGVDQRENDRGRSDTMIMLSVNPIKHSILMFNIPRDTRTEIVGHGTTDKINHAYAFGGVEMSIQTVESFLDYSIDYYVKVNMEGFARLIDLIGGVQVDNPFSFKYDDHTFKEGHLSLSGTEALMYARMRYDDPRGDLGRNTRQREIVQEIMDHASSLSNVTRLHSLLGEIGDSVKTNITFNEMKKFVTDYRPKIQDIETVEIGGKGQMINGIWYYIVDQSERTRIHNRIKEHLQDGV
ncbi:LytR family transcriptional attenuator [Paenibacillus taihuensis]|uniref:LytR family transcriptional attenuator n=1 Tax=Paenibacillus taihuensis TaxID=1156355 RepID=A0A3D9Q4Z9_9BACL|nr:LCP family protein [Paenibacillus taihuensis]REE57522.1 LytR family transcriptional attenuator [Paenibacillus taihuensis]